MKILKLSLACLMMASALFMFSCKKDNDTTDDNDTSGASDNALAEGTSNDIVSMAGEVADNGSLSNLRYQPTDVILTNCVDSVVKIGKVYTVSFNGSACKDGRTRSGQLVFDFSGSAPHAIHYRDPGFKVTVTSNNYVVNGHQVSIMNKTITNTTDTTYGGFNFDPTKANETWHITANISITKASGGTVSWTCDRVKTLLNTSDPTVYRGDSVNSLPIAWNKARIGITGNASGTRINGQTFTVTVTSQLIRDFGKCGGWSNFIEGTLDFTPSGKIVRHVDYSYSPSGSGLCDDWISVAIRSKTYYTQIP